MDDTDRKRRGVAARLVQHESAIQTAFDDIETDIVNDWQSAWTQRGRERAHADLRAIKRLREKLAQTAAHAPRN